MMTLAITDEYGNTHQVDVELRNGNGQSNCHICGKHDWDSSFWDTAVSKCVCSDCLNKQLRELWISGVIAYRKSRGDF